MNMSRDSVDVVGMAYVEDATIILGIAPKEGLGKLKKEIRHRLDNQKYNETSGKIHYVDGDFNTISIDRDDSIEVIITKMDLQISMSKYIPERNAFRVVRKTLKAPPSVTCVGYFDLKEYKVVEL